MASIATKLTKNLRLLSLFNNTIITKNVQRNLFAPSALGIDNFKNSQSNNEVRIKQIDRENLIKRLTDAVNDANSKILSEDLKRFLYLMRSDEEADLFVKSLVKYESSDIGVGRFSFITELMKYFYTTNKLEKAIEVYKNDKLKNSLSSPTALLVLLNKLSEEKHYADVVKIFDYYLSMQPKHANLVTKDVLRLVSEALYHLKNAEAVAKSKEYMKLFKNEGKFNLTTKVAHFLLALETKDFQYAYELTSDQRGKSAIDLNMRAMALAGVNRFSESFDRIEDILHIQPGFDEYRGKNRDIHVYPTTLKHIRARLEEAKNEVDRKKFEELNDKVLKSKRLRFTDLPELIDRVLLNRELPKGPDDQNRQQGTEPRNFNFENRRQRTEPRNFNFENRQQSGGDQRNFQQRRDQGSQRNDDRRPFRSQFTSNGAPESQQGQQKQQVNKNEIPKSTTIPPPPSTSS